MVEGSGSKKTKTPCLVMTRLGRRDEKRFKALLAQRKAKMADVLRQALVEYMDRQDKAEQEESERELVEELKRSVKRLAALLAGNFLEIGEVRNVLFARSNPEDRDEVWAAARSKAVQKLRKNLVKEDAEAQQALEDAISSKK